jgi:hypothetical protein
MSQKVKSLTLPIEAEDFGIPIYLKVIGKKTTGLIEGGTSENKICNEIYIQLSALPPELRERVKTFIEGALRV